MARFLEVSEPSIIRPDMRTARATITRLPSEQPRPGLTFTGAIGAVCMFPLRAIINACVALRIHPNVLTFVGVVINIAAAWGLAFGGCATLFQTALAIVAGDGADVAQSLLVVTWNCAISGGGVIGGILLGRAGVAAFPWTLLPLLLISFVVAARTGRF